MITHYDFTGGQAAARDYDTEREEIEEILALELDGMTRPRLLEVQNSANNAMELVAIACSSIQSQIDNANTRRETTGSMSDPDWYRRVHGALRSKRWQRQRLQNKIGEISRALRRFSNNSRESLFIEVAKLHLPKETFDRLLAIVFETENLQRNPRK